MTISHPRIEVKDAASAGWFDAREEARMPVRGAARERNAEPAAASDGAAGEGGAHLWVRRARRIVFDLAIVVGVLTALPVLAVSLANGYFWRSVYDVSNARERIRATEASRPFTVPVDPSITAVQAGRSYFALQYVAPRPEFPTQNVTRAAPAWRNLVIMTTMFRSAMTDRGHLPNSSEILDAVANGFSPEELAYLRALSAAPAWRDFDLVARAPSIDVFGAYLIPFSSSASIYSVPFIRYSEIKDAAEAAVSRAAYHLAIGQRDSAETVLRSIVSFGFRISDNSPRLADELTGRSIVAIGMEGLQRFYTITHDPRASAARAALPNVQAATTPTIGRAPVSGGSTLEQMRRDLIAQADDPREVRGIRFQSLAWLSMAPCTNVREMLFGPRPDVSEAFERAKRDLARFPSEQSFIDVIQRTSRSTALYDGVMTSPIRRFLVGASTISGAVLHNPRITGCTLLATEGLH